MQTKKYLAILLLAFSGSVFAESYLCVANNGIGFEYDEYSKTWINGVYDVSQTKYLISSVEGEDYDVQVTNFGEDSPFAKCENSSNSLGELKCVGFVSHVQFLYNARTKRYIRVSYGGYHNSDKPNLARPIVMDIGTCAEL